jgi:hypothetical protein
MKILNKNFFCAHIVIFLFTTYAIAEEKSLSYDKMRNLFINQLSTFLNLKKNGYSISQFNFNSNDYNLYTLVGVNGLDFKYMDGIFTGIIYIHNNSPESDTFAYPLTYIGNFDFGKIIYGLNIVYDKDKLNKTENINVVPVLSYYYSGEIIDLTTKFLSDDKPQNVNFYSIEPGFKLSGNYKIYPYYTFNDIDDYYKFRQTGLRFEIYKLDPWNISESSGTKLFMVLKFNIENTYNSINYNFSKSIKNNDYYTYKFEFEYGYYLGLWYSEYYGKGFGVGYAFNFEFDDTSSTYIHMIYNRNKIINNPIIDRKVNNEFDFYLQITF